MNVELKVSVKTKKTSKGQQYFVYGTKLKDTWFKVSFNKTAGFINADVGRYILTVDKDDLSVQEGKPYIDRATGESKLSNPTLWVKRVVSMNRVSDEELRREQRELIDKLFD